MKTTSSAQVGDIIMSGEFVDGLVKEEPTLFHKGIYLVGVNGCHRNSRDPSRAKAKYVVEETRIDGGGTGHDPLDVYPDGWHVVARKLGAGDKYDPKGELIDFYQSGFFIHMVKSVNVVGKLERVINFKQGGNSR